MKGESVELRPVGFIFHEYYSSGVRSNRFSIDDINDVETVRVTYKVMEHKDEKEVVKQINREVVEYL